MGQQKGYKVVETNCSDVRTPEQMREKIKSVCALGGTYEANRKGVQQAVEFENGVPLSEKEVWMRKNKAPMLILDEIDGIARGTSADGTFTEFLYFACANQWQDHCLKVDGYEFVIHNFMTRCK